jgi:hypothetical protein
VTGLRGRTTQESTFDSVLSTSSRPGALCGGDEVLSSRSYASPPHTPTWPCAELTFIVTPWEGLLRGEVSSALLNTLLLSFWTCCISDEHNGTDNSGLDCCDFKRLLVRICMLAV